MAVQRIEILEVENRSGRSKKGNDYSMDVAQCVVHSEGGKRIVGQMVLPKGVTVKPGFYTAVCSLARDMSGEIRAVVEGLTPVNVAKVG